MRIGNRYITSFANALNSALILAFALILIAGVPACRTKTARIEPQPVLETRDVTDDLGRSVRIPLKITRAVSLAPSITESIFAAGAGDRLVGVTTYCDYPEEAKSIQKVGDTISPNLETIVALQPDVVFVSTASQIEAFKKTLEQNGTAVYVTDPKSLDDVIKELTTFGDLFGTSDIAAKKVTEMEGTLGFVGHVVAERRLKNKPPLVFLQISREPLFTIGKDSFLTDFLHQAGGESVTKNIDSAYPKLSKETAVALNPEVIILSASDDNREPNEVFKNSPAMRNGRVLKIDADLLSRPGPRLVNALTEIANNLY